MCGSFVGAVQFGTVANPANQDAGMLQIECAGVAPRAGEYRYAFSSDCLPWATNGGSFVIDAPPPREEVPRACAALVDE